MNKQSHNELRLHPTERRTTIGQREGTRVSKGANQQVAAKGARSECPDSTHETVEGGGRANASRTVEPSTGLSKNICKECH